MSSSMNVKEAEKIADRMSYREAIMNCLHARCVPYRKATKIKMKRLLESIGNDFTDDLFNQGYSKGYQQGKADEQIQSIEDAKKQATEYLNALDKAKKEAYQQGAREFAEWIYKYLGKGNKNTMLYTYRQSPVGFIWQNLKTVDEILAEWQKGKDNE